jgi:hypothetical protein
MIMQIIHRAWSIEGRRQRTEDRGQRSEVNGQSGAYRL